MKTAHGLRAQNLAPKNALHFRGSQKHAIVEFVGKPPENEPSKCLRAERGAALGLARQKMAFFLDLAKILQK